MSDSTVEMANVWGIHSSKEDRPVMRGWAKSEEEAQSELERIKKNDGERVEDDYWIVQMTASQVETFQAMGTIPADL